MNKIKLHIGAHKTATTHIQCLLAQSRPHLSSNYNIGLSIPSDLRAEWIPLFFEITKTNNKKIDQLYSLSPRRKTWIFSEENFSGSSYELTYATSLYPNLKERLAKFYQLFSHADIEVFFSIRSYETFYRSAYLEVIRNRGYFSFNKFYNDSRFKSYSWVHVIDAIASIIPQNNITLWQYEDTKDLLSIILSKLTDIDDISILKEAYTQKVTRPSISQKTLEEIKELSKSITQEQTIDLIEKLNKVYPSNTTNRIFYPFNEPEERAFQRRYLDDIQSIKCKYPKINFL